MLFIRLYALPWYGCYQHGQYHHPYKYCYLVFIGLSCYSDVSFKVAAVLPPCCGCSALHFDDDEWKNHRMSAIAFAVYSQRCFHMVLVVGSCFIEP